MLLRQPRRVALLAGKLVSMIVFAAVVLAVAEAPTWLAAMALAPTQDIPTGEWRSLAAVGH